MNLGAFLDIKNYYMFYNLKSEIFAYFQYTHSVLIRNGPIRHTSEMFGFFKK